MSYQLTQFDTILRLADGASIPPDTGNRDYQEYLEWLAAGNTPEPVPAPPVDTSPNYQEFLDQMIASALYQKILAQSTINPVVNTTFTAAMGAIILAALGRPNVTALQSGITSLLSSMTLDPADIPSLQALVNYTRLDSVISLEI
jgi:hypothetical protein